MKNILKTALLRILITFRFFPRIIFTFMPFKIYEFKDLLRGITISKEDLILDLGCGRGLQTLLVGKKCKKIIGIDTGKISIASAKTKLQYLKNSNVEFRCTEIADAGFVDEQFDKIFSFCVIEHIPNYRQVLNETYRCLKNGGQMIISVDSLGTIKDTELIEMHKTKYFVEKYYKKDELYMLLEETGFKNIKIYPIFKSYFARNVFAHGVKNSFHYGYLNSLFLYLILKHKEKYCENTNEGLMLVAKCFK